MLLAVDVGNTNTVLGLYDLEDGTLRAHWRLETDKARTGDEYAIYIRQLMELDGLSWGTVTAGILSSVVPPVQLPLEAFFRRWLKLAPLVVGPGIKTGMPILTENPREVGADRIVNAVAAYELVRGACVVVDFGTATTFDLVSPKGEYLGGVIAPGMGISADALFRAAAKLPRVELTRPAKVIGRNTVASMQSGLYFGYVGLVDSIVERMRAEIDYPVTCLATGGLASLLSKDSKTIEQTDEMLTLRGLKILYDRNRGEPGRGP
jgi:type III pantothenate kinase